MTDQTPILPLRRRDSWPDDMLARCMVKWIGKLTLNQIAADLTIEFRQPITRNAVIGQVRRHGWDKKWPREAPANIVAAITANKERGAEKSKARVVKPAPRPQYTRAPDTPLPAHMPIPPGNGAYPEHWLCQWPQVDKERDALKCESPRVEGRPYCDDHCRRAYTSFGVEYPKSTTVWLSSAGAIRRGQ